MNIVDLGVMPYSEALAVQLECHERVRQGEEDTLFLVEHPPVITFGRHGGEENLLLGRAELAARGVEIVKTARGGNITCHNPGQLVGYPVISLSHWQEDVHWYVEQIEEVLIRTAGAYGITAGRKARYTGVWAGNRKLAAIGVSVRRWITGHGFALNVNNDLSLFQQIIPCGIEEFGVTSLRTAGVPASVVEVSSRLLTEFATVFAAELQQTEED